MPFAIYSDEDTSPHRLTKALREAGYDCLSAVEAGRGGYPDDEQLQFAAESGRAILTSNRKDFMRLHTEWMEAVRHHAGIIIVTHALIAPGVLMSKLLQLQGDRSPEAMRDAILFISPGSPSDR